MNNDDFEKQLRAAPFRSVPTAWRQQILEAARRRPSAPAVPRTITSGLPGWTHWLWPRPAAWATLGAIWLVILAVAVAPSDPESSKPQGQPLAEISTTASLSDQRALLSQLLDLAAPANSSKPQRRSERRREQLAA